LESGALSLSCVFPFATDGTKDKVQRWQRTKEMLTKICAYGLHEIKSSEKCRA
jgi:hypothetical protein